MAVACPEIMDAGDWMAGDCDSYPWYAVRVRTKFERTAATLLSRKGYQPFLPTSRVRRFWSDRVKIQEEALFPGYLFCRFDIEKRLRFLTMPNVLGIVGCGRTPQPVPEAEMNSILSLVRSGILSKPWPFLQVGQKVAIEHGPLAGVQGLLVDLNDGLRIVVSIEMLQRSVAAEVDAAWVLPIPSKPVHSANLPRSMSALAG